MVVNYNIENGKKIISYLEKKIKVSKISALILLNLKLALLIFSIY